MIGVIFANLLTTAITTGIITLLQTYAEISQFYLNILYIIPFGAFFCAIASPSGYYFGARYFNVKHSKSLRTVSAVSML